MTDLLSEIRSLNGMTLLEFTNFVINASANEKLKLIDEEWIKRSGVEKLLQDFDKNNVTLPRALFKDGKYVERIRVLLADYLIVKRATHMCMPRKNLSDVANRLVNIVEGEFRVGVNTKAHFNSIEKVRKDLEELLQPSTTETEP